VEDSDVGGNEMAEVVGRGPALRLGGGRETAKE